MWNAVWDTLSTPLFNLLLGILVFKERFNFLQSLAHLLALCGVLNYLWGFGELPWISLGLAGTFSIYGMLRKQDDVVPVIGLTLETLLLLPPALALVSLWAQRNEVHFGSGSMFDL